MGPRVLAFPATAPCRKTSMPTRQSRPSIQTLLMSICGTMTLMMTATPGPARDPQVAKLRIATVGTLCAKVEDLINAAAAEIKLNDPVIDQLLSIRMLGWMVRDYAGRDRLSMGRAIGAERVPSLASQQEFADFRARVDLAWTALRDVATGAGTRPEISAVITKARAVYFVDFIKIRDASYAALLNGEKPPVANHDWIKTSNPPLEALADVSNMAVDVLAGYAQSSMRAATQKLVLESALALAFMAI